MTEEEIFNNFLLPLEETEKVIFESVETGAQNPGFPDIVYFTERGNGAIELKVSKNTDKSKTLTIPFRKGQQAKLIKFQRVTKKAFVLMFAFESFYLIDKIKRTYDNEQDLKESSCFHGRSLNKTFLEALRKLPPS